MERARVLSTRWLPRRPADVGLRRKTRLIPPPPCRPDFKGRPAWGLPQTRSYLRIHSPSGGVECLNANSRRLGRHEGTVGENRGVSRSQNRGFSMTSRLSHPKSNPDSTRARPADNIVVFALAMAMLWLTGPYIDSYFGIGDSKDVKHKIFDAPRFTPFEIVKREQVSKTSVVLTLRPKRESGKGVEDPYGKQWDAGTWSVEFKQPELMIAREYTPLPPLPSPKEGEESDLRFLIRKEIGGEMSGYLFVLPQGYILNLRGPKEEFGFRGKGGHCDGAGVSEVVFLAGGTGIASALQVCYSLLERKGEDAKDEEKPRIKILWSNRRTEDRRQSGPISEIIADLKLKHGENFEITYLVDEEGTFADSKVIAKAMRTTQPTKPTALHTKTQTHFIMISGPQGYVEYIAGPKKWEDGKEKQGPVGGLLEKMGVKSTRWTVWKL